jgi:Kef-type K+ transport system membrane component KefB
MLWIMAIADLFGDAIQLPGIVGAFLAGLAVMSISSNSKSRISRTS